MNVIPIRRAQEPARTLNKPHKRAGYSLWLSALWVTVAIMWPILRWMLVFDVTFQFIRMLAEFMRRGLYIDWIFFLHFAVYVSLICFVTSKR